MTIFQQWQQLSQSIMHQASGSYNTAVDLLENKFSTESRHFLESFAVNGKELLFLCLLEKEKRIDETSLQQLIRDTGKQQVEHTIKKLSWLGWIKIMGEQNDKLIYPSDLYFRRQQLWENKEWVERNTGIQPGYPSEEEMLFPMKPEVYERKLEHISDNLQQEQFEYQFARMWSDKLEKEDIQSMKKQKELIELLLKEYKIWKMYTPKYYYEE